MSLDAESNHHNPDPHQAGDRVQLPAPTFWPMVFAFGLTLVMAGLVTQITVSIVGLIIFIRAGYGWWHNVIPHEEHEIVALRAHAFRASPIRTSTRSVVHLKAGEQQHRVRIPEEIHPYSSGIKGGLAGGAAMAVLACLYGQFAEGSIWYPINLLAAGAIPSMANASLEQLKAFNGMAFGIAFVGHGVISLLVGMLYAVSLPMFPRKAPLWAGIIAPLFWTGIVAASLELVNPKLNSLINWPWFIVCQLGFGLVGGFVVFRTQRVEAMQTWPFAYRASVAAGGIRPPGHGDEGSGKPGEDPKEQ